VNISCVPRGCRAHIHILGLLGWQFHLIDFILGPQSSHLTLSCTPSLFDFIGGTQ
jgi:hypothetical protein